MSKLSFDTPYQLLQYARRFFSGTLLSQLTSKSRDLIMAYVFGTSPSFSALVIALNFVSVLRRFLGKGIVHYVFVPQFESLRKSSSERAFCFFRDLASTLTAILLTFVLVVELILWGLLAWIDFSVQNREMIQLSALVLPSVIFICLFGLNSALLSCERVFFMTSVAPVIFNFVWIVALLLVAKMEAHHAVSNLAITVGIAAFMQWLITAPSIARLLGSEISKKWWHGIQCFSKDLKKIMKPLLYGSLGVGAMQINSLIDSWFARQADLSAPSYLYYSIKMYQIPLDLFSLALSIVLLPSLSRALEQKNPDLYQKLLDSSLRRGLYLMIPATAALIVLAGTVINLFYHRGKFTDLSVYETVRCLAAYALGLLPQTLVLMLVPACYACREYHFPIKAALIALAANTFLDALFTYQFHGSGASIAMATSFCTFLNCALLARMLSKKLNVTIITPQFKICAKKMLLGTLVAASITLFIGTYLLGDHTLHILLGGALPTFTKQWDLKLLQAGILSICFTLLLMGMNRILKIKASMEMST